MTTDTTRDLAGNDVSTENTGANPAAPVKKAAKKASTKKAAKAPKKGASGKAVKKAPAKAAKKASKKAPTGEKKARTGLGKTRLRILKALSKTEKGLTGSQLAEKAEVHPSLIGNQVGYRDPEINAREVHKDNLVNKKYVKIEQEDRGGKDVFIYKITAAGKEALKKVAE
jgi:hypothetical protein